MRIVGVAVVVLLFGVGGVDSLAQKKPGTSPPVPLVITVHDEFSLGVPCGICGDGIEASTEGSTYTDGVDGVEARIDQYGNLIFNLQPQSLPFVRGLTYNYGTAAPAPPTTTGTVHYLATIGATTRFQEMEWNQPQRVTTCPAYTDEPTGTRYVHAFQRDCYISDSAAANTSFLVVTRVLTDEWTVETESEHLATVFSIATKGRTRLVAEYGESRCRSK